MDYDVTLFEKINAEYRAKPVKPQPIRHDPQTYQERAERRIRNITKQLGADLAGSTALDLGCGHGWLTSLLPSRVGVAEAIGIDVRRYSSWDEHTDPRVRLIAGDLSSEPLIPPGSVDFILSGAVLEHVSRPLQMLEAIRHTLREGGRAWLYFNLYRGPQASHRYNEVNFPWPHLLFDNDVCAAYYERHHDKRGVGFSWVNAMTLAHYVHACHELGFRIVTVKRRITPIDIGFYRRFEDKLGRYPALDLETDFATLVLEKSEGEWPLPGLGYLGRQREFEAELAASESHAATR